MRLAVDADADDSRGWRRPAAIAAESAGDAPFPRRGRRLKPGHFAPEFDDLPDVFVATGHRTGIVFAAQSSDFQTWRSVPQIAVLRMRISTSL